MKRRLFKTLVALLAIAAAAAGPVRGQSNHTKYTSWVAMSALQVGDTLAEGFSLTGGDANTIYFVANRHKNNENLFGSQESINLGWIESIGANCVFSTHPYNEDYTTTFAPVDENGRDGDAWVVTEVESIAGFTNITIAGITIPVLYTVTFAEGTEDVGNWSFTPAAAANTGVIEGTVVTVKYNGTSRINSIELKSKMLTTPLTIEALTAGTIEVQNPQSGMQYTLNSGTKTAITDNPTEITVAVGDKVAFYGNGTSITNYEGTVITGGTANVKVYGNIMSLVNEEHFDTATTLTTTYQFYSLFENNEHLKDASGLMLPATTLAPSCYSYMFNGCESLTTAPALPATTLASNCYAFMFYGCSSLTTAPALPATTLANDCYAYMFQGCTRLTTAPELPAQTLVSYCYYKMFTNCTKLNSVTCLATSGINQDNSTGNWLNNAGTDQSVTTMTFNAASPVNWPTNSASGIPSGWTLVTPAHTPLTLEALTDGTIKVQSPKSGMQYTLNGGAKTPVTSAAIDVVAGDKVAFYGNGTSITSYDDTRIAGGDADVKVYGNIMSLVDEENFATATTLSVEYQFYNLFSENNHLKDASGLLLPATTLAPTCYAYMFHYCSSLTAAPAELPATTLAEACYRGMFQDCMSLTTAPELPAQTLVSYCYAHMFQLCTKLNSVTCLATSGINQNGSTENWLDNAGTDQSVTTKTFNAASTATWPTSVSGIPEGWTLGAQSTPEPVTLVPTGNTNEWAFTMPADNMLLMLNYATPHTVRFADGNNGWQVQDVTAATSAVAPAVLQNVIAGDSLVATYNGTKKVKSVKAVKYVPPAATVTTDPTATAAYIEVGSTSALVNAGAANGGTMMYAVTTTNAQPASTADFSATRPTAQGRSAGTYYVWYYAKADADHSDSEIAGPVPVTLAVMTTLTWNSSNVFNSGHWQDAIGSWEPGSLTYEGITISKPGDGLSSFYAYDDLNQTGQLDCFGNQGDSFTFTAPSGKMFCKIEIIDNSSITFTNYGNWTRDMINKKIVWSGTAANAVTLGTVHAAATYLNSIVFKLIDAQ